MRLVNTYRTLNTKLASLLNVILLFIPFCIILLLTTYVVKVGSVLELMIIHYSVSLIMRMVLCNHV